MYVCTRAIHNNELRLTIGCPVTMGCLVQFDEKTNNSFIYLQYPLHHFDEELTLV